MLRFILTCVDDSTEIEASLRSGNPAPRGFNDLQLTNRKSDRYEGYYSEFTATLGFCQATLEFIADKIANHGYEAKITCDIYESNDGLSWDRLFPGVLDLTTYNREELFIDVSVIDSFFDRDIRDNSTVLTDYNSIKTFDNTTLPGYTEEFKELTLYGIEDVGASIPESNDIKGVYPYELFNKVLQKITNVVNNPLRSSVFGRTDLTANGFTNNYPVNGDLALILCTNGKLIRGWEEDTPLIKSEGKTSLIVTFEQLWRFYNTYYPLGIGVIKEEQEDGSIEYYVEIEKKEYFYSNQLYTNQIEPDNIAELRYLPAEDLFFSSIKAGNAVDNSDNEFGATEYTGLVEYKTPINAFKNQLDLVSEYRISPVEIETLRRAQINPLLSEQEQTNYDNNIYFIDCFIDSVGNLRSKNETNAAGFQSVSGVYGDDPLYTNIGLRATQKIWNWKKWITLDYEFTSGLLTFQSFENLSKVITQKVGSGDIVTDRENIDASGFDQSIFSGRAVEFLSYPDRDTVIEYLGSKNKIVKFWDYHEKRYNYGWLPEWSNTPFNKETNYKLYEVRDIETLTGLILLEDGNLVKEEAATGGYFELE